MQECPENTQSGNQSTVDWKANGIPDINLSAISTWTADSDAIACFQNDGVALIRGAFSQWVEPLRSGLQRNLDSPQDYAFPCESLPEGAPGRFFDSYCNWLLIPEYFEHVTQSCAASMAGQLMQSSKSQFFHEHAFCKEPGTQRATPWHQDLPYYCVDGENTVSLYVALDKSPAEVAVRFVRGSHLWGKLFHPVDFLDGANFESHGKPLEPIPDVDGNPDQFQVIAWDLEPGDCVAFDYRTLHGTTSGRVNGRRRAVSTRWLGDDVTFCERPIKSSPPFPDINLNPGEPMREDWFPVLWRRN